MQHKYPKLSEFVFSAKQLESKVLDKSIEDSTQNEIQRILNESVVTLSVCQQHGSMANQADESKRVDTVDTIQKSVAESININAGRVKSILADLLKSERVDGEREEFWINKLAISFGFDGNLPLEEKAALVEHKLSTDPNSLSLATFTIERFRAKY